MGPLNGQGFQNDNHQPEARTWQGIDDLFHLRHYAKRILDVVAPIWTQRPFSTFTKLIQSFALPAFHVFRWGLGQP